MMSTRVIEAEYDGKVFVPKQPVPLSAGQVVRLFIQEVTTPSEAEWEAFFRDLDRRPPRTSSFDFDALRRKNLYGDRDEHSP